MLLCSIKKHRLQPTVAKGALYGTLDYLPRIKAPNAKPSTRAPMMIIAV